MRTTVPEVRRILELYDLRLGDRGPSSEGSVTETVRGVLPRSSVSGEE